MTRKIFKFLFCGMFILGIVMVIGTAGYSDTHTTVTFGEVFGKSLLWIMVAITGMCGAKLTTIKRKKMTANAGRH